MIMDEEKTLPRATELMRVAQRVGYACTDFLDPAQQEAVSRAARDFPGLRTRLQGGYERAERAMVQFYDVGEEDREPPLVRLRITWNGKFNRAPQHREVLGAVLGTGIMRSKVGDILLGESSGSLFVADSVADYLCAQCDRAGHVPLQLSYANDEPLELPPMRRKRETVASPRLDGMVAAAADLSRGDAAALVRGERIKLNHRLTDKTDAQVQEGDLISVSGKGRYRVLTVRETKKGRFAVEFEY